MLRKLTMKLVCRLGLHSWKPELRGHQYEGTVYPLNFRVCPYCHAVEQEIFDELDGVARWVKSSLNQ